MAARTISTRVAIDGESEYKQSVSNINSSLGTLKSELTKVKAEFHDSANSMDALRSKGEVLNALHGQQVSKVQAVEAAYENARHAQQEYAAKIEQAQAKVTGAQGALQKLVSTTEASDDAQAALTAELEKYNRELADVERYNEAAQRGVNDWKKELNNSQRELTKLNKDISQNNQYLYEAKQSADGCAVSIDQYGKTVRTAEQATGALAAKNKNLAEVLSVSAKQLSSVGNTLTVGLTVPLVAGGVAAVNYASDTAESMNKVEVAFGYAAEGVKKWSETTLTSYGLAKGTALDMAALFGDMATSMGYSQAEAADMSKTLVALAADLASFKNISIGEASTALKSIFTGETESLKNLGVVMTEVNLKQFAMEQGMRTAYEQMSQAEKVSLRYQYVLDKTANAQGDFARTSDGTANQLRIFQESLKEAAAIAGDELLPIITPIIAQLGQLIQRFGDLDEGTRKAVVQTALFLAALGPMMKLAGGVATAVNAGVMAYGALKTALTAATAAQAGLNAVMSAATIGAVVPAVGALAAVLGALVLTAALTAEKTDGMNQRTRETKQAYEAAQEAIQAESTEISALVATLDDLASAEQKTAAQKAALKSLVDQLNAAVPNLSLAYNEQTDSLNMTTEAIERMVAAQREQAQVDGTRDSLTDLYAERVSLEEQLAAAAEKRSEAERKYAALDGLEQKSDRQKMACEAYKNAMILADMEIERLTAAQGGNEAQISTLEAEYNALTAAVAATGLEVHGTSSALESFRSVLEELQGGYELLAKAQKEMTDGGSISVGTLTTLMDKYPELTEYLVEAADGYHLTAGALENYMATQRSEYELANNSANAAAQTVIRAEEDKLAAIDATTMGVKEQLRALAALYEAKALESSFGVDYKNNDDFYAHGNATVGDENYKRAQEYLALAKEIETTEKNLADVSRAGAMLGRESRPSGGAKKKTPAESELEAYREAVKELDYQRDMDLMSEEEYYKEKEALGARYLGGNQDERQKLDVELYDYRQGAYERELSALDKSLVDEQITLQQHLDGLASLQKKYLVEGSAAWKENDRKQQTDKMTAYQDALDDIKYFRDIDLISAAEYHMRLSQLQREYLTAGSDEWRNVNRELHQYSEQLRKEELDALKKRLDENLDAMKDAYNDQVAALKDSLSAEKEALREKYDAEKAAAKAAYQAKKDSIKAELALEEKRLNGILDGIDAEVQARRELREDEDQDGAVTAAQRRLNAARAQLEFARSDEDKKQWQDEILRAQAALDEAAKKKDDTAFYREKELEKEKVREELDAAKDLADQKLDAASKDYDALTARLESTYNATVKRLESEYEARIKAAEAEYEASVERMKQKYEAAAAKTENASVGATAGISAVQAAKSMAGAVTAAAKGAVQVMNSVQNITKNASVNVTINQASSLTSGQIGAAVKRAIEAMDQ